MITNFEITLSKPLDHQTKSAIRRDMDERIQVVESAGISVIKIAEVWEDNMIAAINMQANWMENYGIDLADIEAIKGEKA